MAGLIVARCAECRMGVFIGERVCADCVEARRTTPEHYEPEDHDD